MRVTLVLALILSGLCSPSLRAHGESPTSEKAASEKCILSAASSGQTITLQGKIRSEPHDLALDVPGCNDTVLLTFAGESDNDVSSSKLCRNGKLNLFQKYTRSTYKDRPLKPCISCPKYGDIEAKLTGKLEIATLPPGCTRDSAGFIRDPSGKVIGQFGWGHPVPFAKYRLVIMAVSRVTARKLPPPT